ncbi:MAG: site-specific integrase [Xanthobacteraceae bacterium]|nr:site-specific integrase [Xanthobacteraceae bacterium]
MAEVSRLDIARRYGMFLDFLERTGALDRNALAAAHTTPENVANYIGELQSRVRSVSVWNCIYKLRRCSEVLARQADFRWLSEIEKDIAFTMQPKSKYDRLVLSERLLEAAMALIIEAELSDCSPLERAKRVRNATMIAFLSLCPIRAKNFAGLQIGTTFRNIAGVWWITLPKQMTKSRNPLERQMPSLIRPIIDKYIDLYRPVLLRPDRPSNSLWPSVTRGAAMLPNNISTLISKITEEAIGISVSPHLFRTAVSSTAAIYGGDMPYLGSALLDHRDPRVNEDHYKRTSSMSAAQTYAELIDGLRNQ